MIVSSPPDPGAFAKNLRLPVKRRTIAPRLSAEADPGMSLDATLLLRRLSNGDSDAAEELLPILYRELHDIASRCMDGERSNHTLQPTALVNEAFLRLIGPGTPAVEDRGHFLNLAARAMRNILVDHARRRNAEKRGNDRTREPLDDALAAYAEQGVDVLAVNEALQRLAAMDEQLARIVDLRFFAGLPVPEVAKALGLSLRTAERGWFSARAWLRKELDGDLEPDC